MYRFNKLYSIKKENSDRIQNDTMLLSESFLDKNRLTLEHRG
jgi:hypothetical protein